MDQSNIINAPPVLTEPDLLAGAVLNSLSRKLYYPLSWGVLPTFIASILTLGILPMLAIPNWLKGVIAQHEQQLWHLAEWLRIQTADPLANQLQEATKRIRFRYPLAILAWASLLIAVGSVFAYFDSRVLNSQTYFAFGFGWPGSLDAVVFALSLAAAALFNWLHVWRHQRNVERFITLFNAMASKHGWDLIPARKRETGLRPLWLLAGIALSANGALWPIPVMLAAGMHRRYTMVASIKLRGMLAERLRAILINRRPTMRLPKQPLTVTRACIRPNCRAALPSAAVFCPRCGTRIARSVDIVA